MLISGDSRLIFYHDLLTGYLEYFTVPELWYEVFDAKKMPGIVFYPNVQSQSVL